MRIVIADDSLLIREGIESLLRSAGIDVVAKTACAEDLLTEVERHVPDVALVDVRMPPDFDDEGVRAAQQIRARHPQVAIVILSQHVDLGTATRVLAASPERLGYLLKDRVNDLDEFVATLRHVAAGGSALDADVVAGLLTRTREEGRLGALTPREREVLHLVAEGRSNKGIAERLAITERAVQKHVTAIFGEFSLPPGEDDNRRILAVLAYLDPVRRRRDDARRPA